VILRTLWVAGLLLWGACGGGTVSSSEQTVGGPFYFASMGGYETPVRLTDRIPVHEALGAESYYRGTFDDGGRIVAAEKFLLERQPLSGPVEVPPREPSNPSRLRFFLCDHADSGRTLPGTEVEAEQAADLDCHVQVRVAKGDPERVELAWRVDRVPWFRHAYTYRDDGSLELWRHSERGGPEGVTRFGPDGRPTAE